MRSADIMLFGRLAGRLDERDEGGYSFRYDPAYLALPDPKVDTCPDLPYEAMDSHTLLYDLIYNPDDTLFMKRGREHGATVKNGLEMLLLQAFASWEFWNSED